MVDIVISIFAFLLALVKMVVSVVLLTLCQPAHSIMEESSSTMDDSPRIILVIVGVVYTIVGIIIRRLLASRLIYGLVYLIVGLVIIAVVCIPYEHLASLQSSYIQIAMVLSSLAYLCVTSEQLTLMRKQLDDNKKAMQLSKQPCISIFPQSTLVYYHGNGNPQISFENVIENCGDSPALNIQTTFYTVEPGSEAIVRHTNDIAVLRATDATPRFNRKTFIYNYSYTENEMACISRGEYVLRVETSYLNVYGTCFKTCESFFLDLRDRARIPPNTTSDADMLNRVNAMLAPGKPYMLTVRRDPLAYRTAVVDQSSIA